VKAGGPSPEYRAALAQFPKGIAVPGDTYDVVRAKFKPAHGHDPGPDIATELATLGGVGGVWVSLKAKPAQPSDAAILFLHGWQSIPGGEKPPISNPTGMRFCRFASPGC
jgi:hypothetical protein